MLEIMVRHGPCQTLTETMYGDSHFFSKKTKASGSSVNGRAEVKRKKEKKKTGLSASNKTSGGV